MFFKLARCGYTLRVTSQASYSPEYITPTQNNQDGEYLDIHIAYKSHYQWRRQTHILGGQDRFLPMPLSQNFCPPPGDSPPSQKGAIFQGIPPPGDEYPRNIAPPRRANAPGISPPFRIFAPDICDVVYLNNFVVLSSY